jgi:hypothetical protein
MFEAFRQADWQRNHMPTNLIISEISLIRRDQRS